MSEAEKKVLIEKIAQRNKTIHQLTHHLHSLQALAHMQPQTQYRLPEEAMLAAEVTFEKDRMDPAPWEPTSSGDRTDRMNMTASTNTSMNSSSLLLSPHHHHQGSLSSVAFAHHVTASLPHYRGDPLVLPAWDLLEQSTIEGDRVRRDGAPVTTSSSTPSSPSPPLWRSSAVDSGAQSTQGYRDADTFPAPAYTANSYRPYRNSSPPSSSSPSLSRSPNIRVEECERRSNSHLLQTSRSHRGGGGVQQERERQLYQQQQQGEQVGEEEERWVRDRDIGRKSYSKSPTTSSSLGHGRTVVLSWQGQGPGQGLTSCPPLHAARHSRDMEGYREDRQAPYIGCRERDRDRARGQDEHSSSRYGGDIEGGGWMESDAASGDMSTYSAHPLIDSVLTADTVTLADTDNAREKDRAEGGNGAQRYKDRYSN